MRFHWVLCGFYNLNPYNLEPYGNSNRPNARPHSGDAEDQGRQNSAETVAPSPLRSAASLPAKFALSKAKTIIALALALLLLGGIINYKWFAKK
jgi:hypothetical protein